ncbi:MAG: glycosyltransferase [Alistipes sp.]|nr:glycosyltransferase [Alistipes sp.]
MIDVKISFVVPVYNVEAYVAQCLDSIVGQTYPNIDIVVVNDGSTDGSLEIVRAYAAKDSRIKVVDQQNQGLSAARNAGMEHASGDYLWFVDSDDYVAPDACERIVSVLRSQSCDVLAVGRYRFWEDGRCVYDPISWGVCAVDGRTYLTETIIRGIFTASACNKVVRTDFVKHHSIRFRPGILYEDLYFTFQCLLQAENVALVEEPFYFYRQNRAGSIINSIKERDKDVLETVGLLERYVAETAPELSDAHFFKVLIYGWVANAVCFKYPQRKPFSRRANRIVKDVLRDERYRKYVRYFATSKHAEFKWRLPAWLSLHCYPLFVALVYGYFKFKNIFR